MKNIFSDQKDNIENNIDDYEKDIPKDGLAQKRKILDAIEEAPKPFLNLEEKDLGELKKSQVDYKTLVANRNQGEFSNGNSVKVDNFSGLRNKPRY